MRVVALVSGGKDSTYCMMQCVKYGHSVVALANLYPCSGNKSEFSKVDASAGGSIDTNDHDDCELDSYMYQTVGHELLPLYAHCLEVPLYRAAISGKPRHLSCDKYQQTRGDEVEDLVALLEYISRDNVSFDAVASGAILSDYQRSRVEHVCERLGLVSLAYLWQRQQRELLDEMVACRVEAVLVKVACLGLNDTHLGVSVGQMRSLLLQLAERYGVNVCGEGGEYETFTLDCPLFAGRVVIDQSCVVVHSEDEFAPVACLRVQRAHVQRKCNVPAEWTRRVWGLALPALMPSHDVIAEHERQPVDCSPSACVNSPPSASNGNQLTETVSDSEPSDMVSQTISTQATAEESGDCVSEDRHCVPAPRAVVAGQWLYVAPVAGRDMTTAMRRLRQLLASRHCCLQQLVFVDVFVSDLSSYRRHNDAYVSALQTNCRTSCCDAPAGADTRALGGKCTHQPLLNPPVRMCVQVALPIGVSVLLSAGAWPVVASGPERPELPPSHPAAVTLHVQSRSHWAPASVGPYSQAARCGRRVHLAGVIGLEPATQLLARSPERQARLALRHCDRLLERAAPLYQQQQCLIVLVTFVTQSQLLSVCERAARDKWPQALLLSVGALVEALPCGASVEHQMTVQLGFHLDGATTGTTDSSSSQLILDGVCVSVELHCFARHCAAFLCARCSWADCPLTRHDDWSDATGRPHDRRLCQLQTCLRAVCRCVLSRCGKTGAACRLTVYYSRDFFTDAMRTSVSGSDCLSEGCVVVFVPVARLSDVSCHCVVIALANGASYLKED